MDLEKEEGIIQWYKKNNLKIRVQNNGTHCTVAVTLDGYNICFKLLMFEFVDRVRDNLASDIRIERIWDSQRSFIVDSKYVRELINYIPKFINEWNLKISKDTVSEADIISDELWYGGVLKI